MDVTKTIWMGFCKHCALTVLIYNQLFRAYLILVYVFICQRWQINLISTFSLLEKIILYTHNPLRSKIMHQRLGQKSELLQPAEDQPKITSTVFLGPATLSSTLCHHFACLQQLAEGISWWMCCNQRGFILADSVWFWSYTWTNSCGAILLKQISPVDSHIYNSLQFPHIPPKNSDAITN